MHRLEGSHILPYKGVMPQFGERCFLASGACAIGDLVVGDDVSIWFNTVVRADCHYIRIGDRVNIQDNTTVHVTNGRFPTVLADEVSIGHGAVVHGCSIGKRTLVGMGAVVMDDVKVGENCLIAAGALLTPGKEFGDNGVIMGSPARRVRDISEEELKMVVGTHVNYMEYKKGYMG